MSDALLRARLLFGDEAEKKLKESTVIVVGVGGVGSFAVEALARTGVGHLVLIDKDTVEASNINRQLPALTTTIDEVKVDVLKTRIAQINPDIVVDTIHDFYDSNMNGTLKSFHPDFVLDCIDSLRSKQDLITFCMEENIPIISSMGMARKKDPSKIEVLEIEKTSYDPLAKRLRVWKRKNRIRKPVMTVSSTEKPVDIEPGMALPSAVFVPATAGLLMAHYAVEQLLLSRRIQSEISEEDESTRDFKNRQESQPDLPVKKDEPKEKREPCRNGSDK